MVVGLHDFHVMVEQNISRGDSPRSALVQRQSRVISGVHVYCDTFQIQEDIGHILLNTFNGGVLVEHVVDFHFRDSAPGH